MSATILAAYRWLWRVESWDEGQGIVEYLMILAVVSVVAIVALTDLGSTIVTKLYTLSNSL